MNQKGSLKTEFNSNYVVIILKQLPFSLHVFLLLPHTTTSDPKLFQVLKTILFAYKWLGVRKPNKLEYIIFGMSDFSLSGYCL